jgi:hypothetical protein
MMTYERTIRIFWKTMAIPAYFDPEDLAYTAIRMYKLKKMAQNSNNNATSSQHLAMLAVFSSALNP